MTSRDQKPQDSSSSLQFLNSPAIQAESGQSEPLRAGTQPDTATHNVFSARQITTSAKRSHSSELLPLCCVGEPGGHCSPSGPDKSRGKITQASQEPAAGPGLSTLLLGFRHREERKGRAPAQASLSPKAGSASGHCQRPSLAAPARARRLRPVPPRSQLRPPPARDPLTPPPPGRTPASHRTRHAAAAAALLPHRSRPPPLPTSRCPGRRRCPSRRAPPPPPRSGRPGARPALTAPPPLRSVLFGAEVPSGPTPGQAEPVTHFREPAARPRDAGARPGGHVTRDEACRGLAPAPPRRRHGNGAALTSSRPGGGQGRDPPGGAARAAGGGRGALPGRRGALLRPGPAPRLLPSPPCAPLTAVCPPHRRVPPSPPCAPQPPPAAAQPALPPTPSVALPAPGLPVCALGVAV